MKIDRVLLVTDTNPLYYGFWNNLSKLYVKKFNIKPTLIFFGDKEEFEKLGLSYEHGDVFFEKKVDGVDNWQYTWAIFYYTKYFPNDVCLTIGIDQIPMGNYFLEELISEIDEDNYVMLIDDHYVSTKQYPKDWSQGGYSQTSYHIAKGEKFNKIYNFENTFEEDINKIKLKKLKPMWSNGWGMDEAYSSDILYNYSNKSEIKCFGKSLELIKRRVECFRNQETEYDLDLLKNNFYIECHACRPYSSHEEYLNNLFENILNN